MLQGESRDAKKTTERPEFVANFRERETRRKKGAVYGYVRTAAIGERISRRCYPQTRGFDQFIPRDEADVA